VLLGKEFLTFQTIIVLTYSGSRGLLDPASVCRIYLKTHDLERHHKLLISDNVWFLFRSWTNNCPKTTHWNTTVIITCNSADTLSNNTHKMPLHEHKILCCNSTSCIHLEYCPSLQRRKPDRSDNARTLGV